MKHTLKIWDKLFQLIVDDEKRHEVRKNDRGFKIGDALELLEITRCLIILSDTT
jgi:hypothetical protein